MLAAGNIHYEAAERSRALNCGGIGVIHQMVRAVGLPQALDRDVQLLKVHLPYHESDHVLNIAYNILAGGTCLEDLELRRNDENYLDALSERLAVEWAVDHHRGDDAVQSNCSHQRAGLPKPGRGRINKSLAPRTPAAVADHRRVYRTFVEEKQPFHIYPRQALFPVVTLGYHIGPLLLAGVQRLFFSVSFMSCSVRQMVLMLAGISSLAFNSSSVMSGF
jgi:hypothetical protein